MDPWIFYFLMTIILNADLHDPTFLFENAKTRVFFWVFIICQSLCWELAFQGGRGLI